MFPAGVLHICKRCLLPVHLRWKGGRSGFVINLATGRIAWSLQDMIRDPQRYNLKDILFFVAYLEDSDSGAKLEQMDIDDKVCTRIFA